MRSHCPEACPHRSRGHGLRVRATLKGQRDDQIRCSGYPIGRHTHQKGHLVGGFSMTIRAFQEHGQLKYEIDSELSLVLKPRLISSAKHVVHPVFASCVTLRCGLEPRWRLLHTVQYDHGLRGYHTIRYVRCLPYSRMVQENGEGSPYPR